MPNVVVYVPAELNRQLTQQGIDVPSFVREAARREMEAAVTERVGPDRWLVNTPTKSDPPRSATAGDEAKTDFK